MPTHDPSKPRRTQAQRREQTRRALLDAAAQSLARDGYSNLLLERVAADAGYTRGAVYHLFADKNALALAAIERELTVWQRQVGLPAIAEPDPVEALTVLARAHAVYCRRGVARLMTLRLEFDRGAHPVGDAIEANVAALVDFIETLINAARIAGAIPPNADPTLLARAYFGAVEGVTIALAGQAPHDETIAERVALGVLGLPQPPHT